MLRFSRTGSLYSRSMLFFSLLWTGLLQLWPGVGALQLSNLLPPREIEELGSNRNPVNSHDTIENTETKVGAHVVSFSPSVPQSVTLSIVGSAGTSSVARSLGKKGPMRKSSMAHKADLFGGRKHVFVNPLSTAKVESGLQPDIFFLIKKHDEQKKTARTEV